MNLKISFLKFGGKEMKSNKCMLLASIVSIVLAGCNDTTISNSENESDFSNYESEDESNMSDSFSSIEESSTHFLNFSHSLSTTSFCES